MSFVSVSYIVVLVAMVGIVASSIRVMREYQRAVMFTLGRFTGVKGPGLILLIPYVQQMVRVDLRTVVLDVPSQDVISRDNVSVKVNAVLYFRVVDPDRAVIQVEIFLQATSQLALTTLRSVLGSTKVSIDARVEPEILGGLVVKVGSRLFDSSIRSKLQRLQLAMKGVA